MRKRLLLIHPPARHRAAGGFFAGVNQFTDARPRGAKRRRDSPPSPSTSAATLEAAGSFRPLFS
jgi:hypothetical protein